MQYTISRQLISIGRSYSVRSDDGDRLFRIAGKLRFARTFSVKDRTGAVLYSVREKLLALHPTFVITRDGLEAAVVTRTADEESGERFTIEMKSGQSMKASGKLWYEGGVKIRRGDDYVGSIRRKQYEVVRETFLADAADNADQGLLLAIGMSIAEIGWHRGQV